LFDNFDTLNVGIDKLNITTLEYIVPNADRLNIDYYGRKAGTAEATQERLFMAGTGEAIEGRKAYFNGQDYGLNISSYGLQVVMSPAKVLQPERPFLLPCTADEIDAAARIVAERIKQDTGVLFPYDTAKVCRLDLAKQHEMDRAIREYIAAFSMLRLKGSRGTTRQFGQQTFQYNTSNSGHQLIFYDKAAEHLSSTPAAKLPAELRTMAHGSKYLRAELRLLKTDYIRKATGTHGTYAELLNGSDKWNSIYTDYLRRKVFTGEYQTTLQFDEGNLRNLFSALASEGNALNGRQQVSRRNLVSRAAAAVGVRCIVDEIGIGTFLAIAAEFGTSDRHIRRTRQYIEQNARIASQLWKGVDTIDLINELRQAFAA
jgi:hypothetical protein